MAELKLPQLPDRTPVKVSISLMPDLHQALNEYAMLYATTYGRLVEMRCEPGVGGTACLQVSV